LQPLDLTANTELFRGHIQAKVCWIGREAPSPRQNGLLASRWDAWEECRVYPECSFLGGEATNTHGKRGRRGLHGSLRPPGCMDQEHPFHQSVSSMGRAPAPPQPTTFRMESGWGPGGLCDCSIPSPTRMLGLGYRNYRVAERFKVGEPMEKFDSPERRGWRGPLAKADRHFRLPDSATEEVEEGGIAAAGYRIVSFGIHAVVQVSAELSIVPNRTVNSRGISLPCSSGLKPPHRSDVIIAPIPGSTRGAHAAFRSGGQTGSPRYAD